jgi:hypothetical protein
MRMLLPWSSSGSSCPPFAALRRSRLGGLTAVLGRLPDETSPKHETFYITSGRDGKFQNDVARRSFGMILATDWCCLWPGLGSLSEGDFASSWTTPDCWALSNLYVLCWAGVFLCLCWLISPVLVLYQCLPLSWGSITSNWMTPAARPNDSVVGCYLGGHDIYVIKIFYTQTFPSG